MGLKKILIHSFFVVFFFLCYMLWLQRPVWHGAGVQADGGLTFTTIGRIDPLQTDNFRLYPKIEISGTARVVSKVRYWVDEHAGLAPFSMVLGWDEMSDEQTLRIVRISQANRSYDIRAANPPLSMREIRERLLHVHAVPANEEIREQLVNIRRGNIVTIGGYLVDAESELLPTLRSDIREDTPNPLSSHVFWIDNLSIMR
ncbi:MAG: hypothetical protein ACNA78_09690 [Balneolaceae bacterium]